MQSYWFVIAVSAGIAAALLGPFVWHFRKERMEALRDAKPMGWTTIAALTAIAIAICVAFGFAVADDGAVLRIACVAVILAPVVLFNALLFAQLPATGRSPQA